jgi:hypothetical protein
VHPSSKEGNRQVHERFLQSLEAVTQGTRPILVADAGFRTPFFFACADAGFDFAALPVVAAQPSLKGRFSMRGTQPPGAIIGRQTSPRCPTNSSVKWR